MSKSPAISQTVAVADPLFPSHVLKPNADGSLNVVGGGQASSSYEAVAASQTKQVLGGSGATGDVVTAIWIYPGTTSPGNVILYDLNTVVATFTGGTDSVSNLVPFPLIASELASAHGAWSVTTGADVSVVGTGSFS